MNKANEKHSSSLFNLSSGIGLDRKNPRATALLVYQNDGRLDPFIEVNSNDSVKRKNKFDLFICTSVDQNQINCTANDNLSTFN